MDCIPRRVFAVLVVLAASATPARAQVEATVVGTVIDESKAVLPGATVTAIDLALHVALGREWQGRDVKPGPVVYVAAEGQRGIAKRIEAWKQTFLAECDDSPVPFYLVPRRLDLIKEVDALIALIRATLGEDQNPRGRSRRSGRAFHRRQADRPVRPPRRRQDDLAGDVLSAGLHGPGAGASAGRG